MTPNRGQIGKVRSNAAGRLAADTVTSFGLSGLVDEAVKRLGTTCDDVGRVETVTSFADPAGTTAVNQVKYAYNGWGRLEREYQEHDGSVDVNTPFVEYVYETGAAGVSPVPVKYVRLGQLVYPNGRNGRAIEYLYYAEGDAAGRIECENWYAEGDDPRDVPAPSPATGIVLSPHDGI